MRQCPQCNYQDQDAAFCSHCGSRMQECCPRCGRLIPLGGVQCPTCNGLGNSGVPGAGLNMGNVGMIKGSINVTNTTTIGTQNNYQGPVNYHVNNVVHAPNASEHLALGQNALRACQYSVAREHFQQSVTLDTNASLPYYYLALAALNGNRPRLLKLVEIQKIQTYLRRALELDTRCAPARFLWAIIIEDFYVLNHMYFPPNTPKPGDLIQGTSSIPPVNAQEMLTHFSAPDNYIWQYLRAALLAD